MSKVIRDSVGFVPEKIIPVEYDLPAVWENLAKPLDPEDLIKDEDKPLPSPDESEPQQDLTSNPPEEDTPSYDSDFSSPQPEEASSEEEAPPPEPEPAPQVDVEAVAEEYFNKGIQAGIERMESDYRLSIKTMQSTCEELNTIRETILKNSLSEMQDLVLQIAEKIIRNSVANQDQTIVETVKEAILQAVKSDEFIVSINPNDYETIKSRSTDFINAVNGLENIIVKPDASIEQGGCSVESSNCTVDATLASQLEIISDAFKNK